MNKIPQIKYSLPQIKNSLPTGLAIMITEWIIHHSNPIIQQGMKNIHTPQFNIHLEKRRDMMRINIRCLKQNPSENPSENTNNESLGKLAPKPTKPHQSQDSVTLPLPPPQKEEVEKVGNTLQPLN